MLALAAHGAADVDDAVDLRDLGSVLRTARFEQFRHARQTAGDVLGLGDSCAASWPGACRRRSCRLRSRRCARRPESSSSRATSLFVVHDDDLRVQIFLVLDDDHRLMPVASSTSCFIVTPSIMSWNSTLPAFSERIGTLYGSHCTKVSPFFTLPPSATEMTEPMTMLWLSSSRPSSSMDGDRAVLVQNDRSCRPSACTMRRSLN